MLTPAQTKLLPLFALLMAVADPVVAYDAQTSLIFRQIVRRNELDT